MTLVGTIFYCAASKRHNGEHETHLFKLVVKTPLHFIPVHSYNARSQLGRGTNNSQCKHDRNDNVKTRREGAVPGPLPRRHRGTAGRKLPDWGGGESYSPPTPRRLKGTTGRATPGGGARDLLGES